MARIGTACIVLAAVCAAGWPGSARAGGERVRVAGSYSGYRCMEAMARAFNHADPDSQPVSVEGCQNREGVDRFVAGQCDVLIHSGRLDKWDRQKLEKAFPTAARQPRAYDVGRFCVVVIVNKANRLAELTADQFAAIYLGRASKWSEVQPGLLNGCEIKALAQAEGSNTNYIVQARALDGQMPHWRVQKAATTAEAVRQVAVDPAAIAVLLWNPTVSLEQVKTIGLRPSPVEQGRRPEVATVFGDEYPLVDELTLYVHPDAGRSAEAFCRFAASKAGGDVAREYLLYPAWDFKSVEMTRRLAELRAGEGDRALVVGDRGAADLVGALNLEYVMAAALMRADFCPASQAGAIGGLLARQNSETGQEIALIEGALSADTTRIHGQRLEQVRPRRLALGARGVAVIVHSLNRLDSLTTNQLKAVFSKRVDDWRVLEASQSELPIHRYGPGKYSPAADVFYDKVLPWAECKYVDRKETAAQIIAAVGADAQGIGFVSLTDVMDHMEKLQERLREAVAGGDAAVLAGYEKDAAGRPIVKPSIKVLAVGPKESAVAPTRQTVNDGSYPLSSAVTLYVSPKAREPAKAFAEFCVTRPVHPILLKHGVAPGFTAEEREREAAAAKRRAEEEAKLAADRARWEGMFSESKLSDDFQAGAGEWDDTSGFVRADLGGGKFAFRAEPARTGGRATCRQPMPAAFQLDLDVQVKFARPANGNSLAIQFGRRPAIRGASFSWGTGYSLAVIDDVANDGLRLERPEVNEKGRIVKSSVRIGQQVTAVDEKTHHLRIISEGDGKVFVFWDDMSRPAISADDGGRFQGGDGTYLGVQCGPGVGASIDNVTVKTRKGVP